MPKFFVNSNQINDDEIIITGDDVNHIVNVLRMKKEDELLIGDCEKQVTYLSEIIDLNKKEVVCRIKEKLDNNNETNTYITLFQGIPKFDKMEWIIQKNTEIGVKEIVPVSMTRCIAKIKDNSKIERWNKIAEIASKQSMRNIVPKVSTPINLNQLCDSFEKYDLILLAYEEEKESTLKEILMEFKEKQSSTKKKEVKIGIIIGPEGGIDSKEIETMLGFDNVKVITLGNRILRTETAGLVLASNIIYELEN